MIPIGTDVRLRSRPVGNWTLVGLNVAIYLLINQFHGAFVADLLPPLHASVPTLYEYISYQFRHANFGHLAGNMLFLWLFGNAVCDRMGSVNYVMFYLAGGVFSGYVFSFTNANPLMGASGAIAAVTAAFLVLFPRVHVTILIWLLIITTIQLPSMFFIVFKIILWDNVIAPSLDRTAMASGVAFSAHLAGYGFGFAVALAMLLLRGLPRHQFDLLALWTRWRRRSGVTGEISFAGPRAARPVVIEEMESRPLEPLKLTAAEQLREDILDRISEHDLDEAARLYQQLLELDASHVLPRSAQLELGNHLAQSQHYQLAVQAYDGFLEAYPTASDAAQVRLYAGLICRRYLRDPRRAIDYLRAALAGLSLESQRHLAAQEIAAAEADISGPDPDPDPG
jgi:membrane associated rhomboid family serine protease